MENGVKSILRGLGRPTNATDIGIIQVSLQRVPTAEGLHTTAYTLLAQEHVRLRILWDAELVGFFHEDAFAPPTL